MKSNRKSRNVTLQALPSMVKLVGSVLVLVAAVAIGLAIREVRLRLYLQKRAAQAPKSVEPAHRPQTRQASKAPEPRNIPQQPPAEEAVVELQPVETEPVDQPTSMAPDAQRNSAPQPETAPEPSATDRAAEESAAKEKRGRAALALIGHDPKADRVWINIINDPTVSPNARSNLIEDLNEDGISNPGNPTQQDLPVIEYRIALVEDLRPRAMDKTNADAFDEAHKDLVNMANRLRQQ